MNQIYARLDCVENLTRQRLDRDQTRYDVDGCLNLGPSEIGYHVHLVEHSTRVGVLLFAVLHRADGSQPARNSSPRLPHSVDSRFGFYRVAVVLSFLRSPALHKSDSFIFLAD